MFQKLKYWFKLLFIAGGTQLVVQLITLFSGILIIRVLLTKEYAFYTIANSMLGTMSLLADSGISTGVMSQGGKVWDNKEKLGSVIVTGLFLRKRFAIFSLLVSLPILAYLLWHNGASWGQILLISGCLVPAFFAALSDSLLEIVPKLGQEIIPIQKNQLFTNILRLVMLVGSLFLLPFTFIALLTNGIPRFWGNIKLKRIAARRANFNQPKDTAVEKEILKIVFRGLPELIYYCLSGQITIWLLSLFSGSVSSIAQVGAVSRLAVIINFCTILFSSFVIPRFARLPANASLLLNRFLQIFVGLVFFAIIITCLVWVFSPALLFVLGKKYASANHILLLYFMGSSLGFISGMTFGIYASRGWILNPLVSIPYNLVVLGIGLLLFKVSTIDGVLLYNLYLAGMQLVLHLWYTLFKITELRKQQSLLVAAETAIQKK